MSFTKKLDNSRGYLIRLVTAKIGDKTAWWVVKITPEKFEVFKVKFKNGINLSAFGEVLYKGWGETVPENILKKLEDYK